MVQLAPRLQANQSRDPRPAEEEPRPKPHVPRTRCGRRAGQPLYLRTEREGFAAATRALAIEEKVWTWSYLGTADMPDHVVVELTVGDATLAWTPEEVRDVVAGLLERAGTDRA
jgi:hypothetical protein